MQNHFKNDGYDDDDNNEDADDDDDEEEDGDKDDDINNDETEDEYVDDYDDDENVSITIPMMGIVMMILLAMLTLGTEMKHFTKQVERRINWEKMR